MARSRSTGGDGRELASLRRRVRELQRLGERLEQTEAALRQSEARYQDLIDSISDGVYSLDTEGRFTFANSAVSRRLGVPRDEVLGMRVLDLVVPGDRDRVRANLRQAMAGEEIPPFELSYVAPNGETWRVEASTRLLRQDGAITALVGTTRDVTERSRAEEALQKANEELEVRVRERTAELAAANEELRQEIAARQRAEEGLRERERAIRGLLNATGESAGLVERDGTVVTSNDTGASRYGMSMEDIIGKCLYDAWPAEVTAFRRPRHEEVFRTGKPVTYEDQRAGIWFETRVYPVFDEKGEVARLAIFARDVTGRKRAEEELRGRERTTQALLEATDESVALLERDGTLVTANDTAARRYGMPLEDIIGKCVYDAWPAEVAAFRRARHEEVFRTGEPVTYDDHRAGMWFETRVFPVFDEKGKVARLAIFARDVTERRRSEEALRQAHVKLVNAAERERKKLACEMHDTLGQRLTALRLKLGGASEASLAAKGAAAALLGELSEGLAKLIHEIRQISHGLYPPALEVLGLYAALRRFPRDWQPAKAEVAVRASQPARAARFAEDVEIGFYRIAQEAVANAVRHGGAARVEVKLGYAKGRLRLAVTDDGDGFDPARAAGKGLGLTSMRERAEAIGASFQVTSRPGRTCVEVRVAAAARDRGA